MHFASGVVRPPFEAGCEFLQVTSGCSYNRCRFCAFYKDARFAVSPWEEIEADLDELAASPWRYYDRIWLQGADSFVLPYDRLMRVAELIARRARPRSRWGWRSGCFAHAIVPHPRSRRQPSKFPILPSRSASSRGSKTR